MALEVQVDRAVCRGSRSCVRRAPATFSLDEERRAVVAAEPGDSDEAIREAANACPFFAIQVKQVKEKPE